MFNWKLSFSLCVLATVMACCCCSLPSALIGGADFSGGDLSDVPTYPGATQSTDNSGIASLFPIILNATIPEGDVDWRHYTTIDSETEVLNWYAENLPDHGWSEFTDDDVEIQGGLMYTKQGDIDTMLVVFAVSGLNEAGNTDVIIGRVDAGNLSE